MRENSLLFGNLFQDLQYVVHIVRVRLGQYQLQSEGKFREEKFWDLVFVTRKRSRKESRSFVVVRASRIAGKNNDRKIKMVRMKRT